MRVTNKRILIGDYKSAYILNDFYVEILSKNSLVSDLYSFFIMQPCSFIQDNTFFNIFRHQ